MSTTLKEWLLKTIAQLEEERDATPGAVNEDASNALAAMKLALASLEAESVSVNDDMAYAFHHAISDSSLGSDEVEEIKAGLRAAFANVTAPPAPVVDADDNFYSWFGREWHEHYQQNQYTTAAKQMLGFMAESAWKAGRRAAMLQGADGALTNEDTKRVGELVMWVKRLAHSLRKANPDSKLQSDAMDYLSRKGLIGVEDILR